MNSREVNDLVDKLLPVLRERDQLSTYLSVPGYCKDVFDISYSDGEYLAQKLVQLKLAFFLRPNGDMRITTFGREIEANGGWKQHLESHRLAELLKAKEAELKKNEAELEKKRLEHEKSQERYERMQEKKEKASLESYQLKLNEMNVQIANKSANGSWFSGIVGLGALLLALYQFYLSNEQNGEITKLKVAVAQVDSILKSLPPVPKQTNSLLDSLPKRK